MTTAYLTVNDLAARWHMVRQTLDRWRSDGTGPRYLKVGSKVIYPIDAIEEWESRHLVEPVA